MKYDIIRLEIFTGGGFDLFYIHGNVSLNGDWPEDLSAAVWTAFMGDDFCRLFGRDAVPGEPGSRTHIIMGRGSLVLSDLAASSGPVLERVRPGHARSFGCFLRAMHEYGLDISMRVSQHDMWLPDPGARYDYSAVISSDGDGLLVSLEDESRDDVCSSLDGYGLTCLCRTALEELAGIDIEELSGHDVAVLRCMTYLDVTGPEFFDSLLSILRRSCPGSFDANLYQYVRTFAHDKANVLRDTIEAVGLFGRRLVERGCSA